MTLVGPRALSLEEYRELEQQLPGFSDRLRILPGLTGLAQIHDRYDEPNRKAQYDLEYIRRMNPFLDTWLLVRSVCNTLTAKWDNRSGKAPSDSQGPESPR